MMCAEELVPRCQHVTDTPWGRAQCVLELDHEERHAYSPGEAAPYVDKLDTEGTS